MIEYMRSRRGLTIRLISCGAMLLALASISAMQGCRSHPPQPAGARGDSASQAKASTPALESMPDFSLKDPTGRVVSLADFRGKLLLVDFWATWCAPCKREMPGYEGLYRRYRSRGLRVVGIALDADPKAVARFAKKLGVTYPVVVNGMDVARYGVQGIPTTILVDRSGFIRKKVVGFEHTQTIEGALKPLLEEGRVSTVMKE